MAGAPWAVVASAMLVALALPAAWTLPARSPVRPTRAREEGAARPVRPVCPDGTGPPERPARERRPGRSTQMRGDRGDRGTRTATMVSDLLAGVRIIVASGPGPCDARLHRLLRRPGHVDGVRPAPGGARPGRCLSRGAALLSCAAVSALLATAVLARFPRALAPGTVIWGCPGPGRRPGVGRHRVAAGARRGRPGDGVRRGAPAGRPVHRPPPGGAGAVAWPGLHHRRQRQDHRIRGGRGDRPLATHSLPAALLLAAAVAAAAGPAYFAIRADRRPHLRTEPHPTGSPGCRPTDCSDRY